MFVILANVVFTGLSTFSALHEKFPCASVLRAVNESSYPAMSVLRGTFGDRWDCVNQFLSENADRAHAIQVHIGNGSCRRFSRCGGGDFLGRLSVGALERRLIAKDARTFEAYRRAISETLASLQTNSKTTVFISLELEDNFSIRAWRNLARFVKREFPRRFTLVRASVAGNRSDGFGFGEWHGLFPRCDGRVIANNDGSEVEVSVLKAYTARVRDCKVRLLWHPNLQGIRSATFVAPKRRTFSFEKEDITLWRKYLQLLAAS